MTLSISFEDLKFPKLRMLPMYDCIVEINVSLFNKEESFPSTLIQASLIGPSVVTP